MDVDIPFNKLDTAGKVIHSNNTMNDISKNNIGSNGELEEGSRNSNESMYDESGEGVQDTKSNQKNIKTDDGNTMQWIELEKPVYSHFCRY